MTSGTFMGISFVLWNFPGAILPLENRALTFNKFKKTRHLNEFVRLGLRYSQVTRVSGYPLWQLSIDHNMDVHKAVHYQVKHRLHVPWTASYNLSQNCWDTLLSSCPPNMLVGKNWWVNCDEQHWGDEETGQKLKKKTAFRWKCPNYFCLRL